MTLAKIRNHGENARPRPRGWRGMAARFVGAMWGVVVTGAMLGVGWTAGGRMLWHALPEVLGGTTVVAVVAGWIPVGFYYERHRFRWIYIVGVYALVLCLTFLVGFSLGKTF